jgi:hypothetical protein
VSLVGVGQRIGSRFQAKAASILLSLEARLDRILLAWLFLAGLACAARVALSPLTEPLGLHILAPYLLLVCAPVVSIGLALRWFADGDNQAQPQFRMSRVGKWRNVDRSNARGHSLYGAGGVMVSLLVGMLVNVPFRAIEYLGAMPAVSGELPAWLAVLHMMMTLDVVVMTSLYAIAFVAALRHVPLFPRLLVAIWGLDLAMQLMTAELVAGTSGLPPAVAGALHNLLDGNVKKVLISVALWLPYLLLSRRVNLTYRSRVPA